MNEACHAMNNGEILNADKMEYPLFHAVLYGDRISTAKFSKRLNCAIKHLPLRVEFRYEYDTMKAVEKGISKEELAYLVRIVKHAQGSAVMGNAKAAFDTFES